MKLTYQLDKTIFNIKLLKSISEIKIINDYEEQEVRKRIDKQVDESTSQFNTRFPKISPVHIYIDYEKECKTIEIYIDEKLYRCSNYNLIKEDSKLGLIIPISTKCRITTESQKEFDIFKNQAENLLEAFKKL